MKYIVLILILIFSSVELFSQPERADIIDYKILSVRKTVFENDDSSSNYVMQDFYSKAGDDSLELYNGVLSFKFIAEQDDNGRVTKLTRYDEKARVDEIHIYKYNKDGSYTIEIIAHGAGTISLAKYNKKNWCMEEEIESSYTLVYLRNAAGEKEKILLKKDNNKTETIAEFYFDKNGHAYKGIGITEGGKTVTFKYNDKGLVSEIRTEGKDENGKNEIETVLIAYEFIMNKIIATSTILLLYHCTAPRE